MLVLTIALGLTFITPLAHGQTLTVLHSFTGIPDGQNPSSGVIRDSAGNLYGTTQWGGAFNWGAVFKLNKTGKETLPYSFTGVADGAEPYGGVLRDAAGNLYGTTGAGGDMTCASGGANTGCGVVFKLDSTGKQSVMYTFTPMPDGMYPNGGLIRDASGNLYGTTAGGGGTGINCLGGCGIVFRVDATGNETVLYKFTGSSDGNSPRAGVVRDAKGNLFGTTYLGGDLTCGSYGCGTVFKLDASGNETVLYSFTGAADGSSPLAALTPDRADFVSTTENGGTFGFGTVFQVDKAGRKTVLYNFAGPPDGASPAGGVVRDSAGNLFGATQNGGAFNFGTVFKLDSTGKETVLYSFKGGADGKTPRSSVTLDSAGNLYGTTFYGGLSERGIVFKLVP